MNKKEQRVFDAISKAYSDEAVQNDPELSKTLLTSEVIGERHEPQAGQSQTVQCDFTLSL